MTWEPDHQLRIPYYKEKENITTVSLVIIFHEDLFHRGHHPHYYHCLTAGSNVIAV